MDLQTTNRWALKEWAVVCRALATGRQSILIRKGGIDEGPDGFRIRHREFWFLPTRFHEGSESLAHGNESLLQEARSEQPEGGKFRVAQYGVAAEVREIHDRAQLDRLASLQILSLETLYKRFQYRQPGLLLILPRVYQISSAHEGCETPELAGCRSWAELPQDLPTASLRPVATDEQFELLRQTVQRKFEE